MFKVLLAVDSSPCSAGAVDTLIEHFRPAEVDVRVFHAVEWPLGEPPYMTYGTGRAAIQGVLDSRDRALKKGEELAGHVTDRLRAHGFAATAEIRESDARSAIVDAALRFKADLIVMGSHGRRGLERFALGSVAESVMRRAPCSVEIVRPHPGSTEADDSVGPRHGHHEPSTTSTRSSDAKGPRP